MWRRFVAASWCVLCLMIAGTVWYFVSFEKTIPRIILCALALGASIAGVILGKLRTITWLERSVRFGQVFNVLLPNVPRSEDRGIWEDCERSVNSVLRERARSIDGARDWYIARADDLFEQARSLAAAFGFRVKTSFRDYLTS